MSAAALLATWANATQPQPVRPLGTTDSGRSSPTARGVAPPASVSSACVAHLQGRLARAARSDALCARGTHCTALHCTAHTAERMDPMPQPRARSAPAPPTSAERLLHTFYVVCCMRCSVPRMRCTLSEQCVGAPDSRIGYNGRLLSSSPRRAATSHGSSLARLHCGAFLCARCASNPTAQRSGAAL